MQFISYPVMVGATFCLLSALLRIQLFGESFRWNLHYHEPFLTSANAPGQALCFCWILMTFPLFDSQLLSEAA